MERFNKFIISKSAIISNVLSMKKQLKRGVLFCACVKANAYSLGAKEICKILEKEADYFAVASLLEAEIIRKECPNSNILILGKTDKTNYNFCAKNKIEISISSLDDLKNISLDAPLGVHIAINTGMNRFGFSSEHEIIKAIKIINQNPNLKLVGAFSHFATGPENNENCMRQYNRFNELKKLLPNNIIYSIASSLTSPFLNFQENMVRVGYNIYAGENNALTISSKIVHVFKVKKGETIGYNCAFVAPKDMMVGVVPLGYADGISRGLSNCGHVIINEKLAPIVGLICMDCFMVCLDGIKAKVGSRVIVLGQTKKQKISILDWAKLTKLSPYELLTNLNYNRCEYIIEE